MIAQLAAVEALDADIVALQELHPALGERMESDLREAYPYQFSNSRGLGLISRYPIVESNIDPSEDSRYVRAVLNVEGQRVVVYSFHATIPYFVFGRAYDDGYTSIIIQNMVEQVRGESDPVIVLCDCNSTPRGKQYAWMHSVLNDAHRARSWGFGLTFPANGDLAPWPVIRIDYVWYSDDFAAMDVKVWDESGGSDHFPLVSRLALRDQ